jgi:hypothetical protein
MISTEQVTFEVFSVYKTIKGRDLSLLRICDKNGALDYLSGRQRSFEKYGNSGYTYFALGSRGTLIKLNTE